MASLQDEFPELTQKVFDALRPIADISHGDSAQVVGSVVLSSVRSAFVVLLQQDLIYSGDEAKGLPQTIIPELPLGVTETDLGPADGGSVVEQVTSAIDIAQGSGSVDPGELPTVDKHEEASEDDTEIHQADAAAVAQDAERSDQLAAQHEGEVGNV